MRMNDFKFVPTRSGRVFARSDIQLTPRIILSDESGPGPIEFVGFLPSWLRSSWRRGGFQQSWGALRALLVKSRKEQPGSPCLWLGLLVSPSSHRVPFSPPPAASLACLLQGGQLCVPTTIP